MSINELTAFVHARSIAAGWWTPDQANVPTKIALIHSEVSEALEGYRRDLHDDHLPNRKMVEVELADAIIRIADLAGYLNCDLDGAIRDKMEYNLKRADHKQEARESSNGKRF